MLKFNESKLYNQQMKVMFFLNTRNVFQRLLSFVYSSKTEAYYFEIMNRAMHCQIFNIASVFEFIHYKHLYNFKNNQLIFIYLTFI